MSGLGITLLRPGALLLLPLIAGIGWWLWRRRGGLGAWDRATDPALMAAMVRLGRVDGTQGRRPLWAGLGFATLAALALAGPAVERRDTLSYRNLDGVLFLIDASDSVMEAEAWPQMQSIARYGLASLGTRPGGLIVFGGDAYVAADMTLDHLQLGQTFALIDAKTVTEPGSRPGRALGLAQRRLAEAEVLAGDVILVTDGAGLGPETLTHAAAIAAQGARLSLLTFEPSAEVEAHARQGGGRVFTPAESEALAAWLSEDARTRLERQDHPLLFWRDLGRGLLILALVPLALMFRRAPV